MGKKKHEEHENLERWLVSYADFITLLFAFFTVLYATSRTDAKKLEAVVNGMNAAFTGGMPRALLDVMSYQDHPPDLPSIVPNHLTMEAADPTMQSLRRNLSGSLSDHVLQLGMVDQSLTLVLPERLLFAAGSAELHPSAYAVLGEVALALAGKPVTLEVIGHADSVPLRNSPLVDNWGLASARSVSVVRYLERRQMRPDNMVASTGITTGESREARSITMRIKVEAPSTGAEVAEAIDPESRRERAGTYEQAGGELPAAVPTPPDLQPSSPLAPPATK
ncbi:MAG: Flagellar motor protein MotB [Pseudomonadota bacterium]|jgi:chemotaxis protein MotB